MERATDLLVEAALHGVVAALAVELLIRRLPVLRLSSRARLRMTVLAFPVVSVPLLAIVVPGRSDPAFADLALLSSARWNTLTIAGAPARDTLFAAFALLGLLILLRDAAHDAAHALRRRGREASLGDAPWLAGPRAIVHALSGTMGMAVPPVLAVRGPEPLLLCRGFAQPRIAISEALVRRLRPEGLRAALAHELSHVRHGDPLRAVGLAALRIVQWFNPVAQIVARRIAQETEWRADDEAVAATGNAPALARALLESVKARGGDFLGAFGRARIAALEIRCRRVLGPSPPEALPGIGRAEGTATVLALVVLAGLIR